MHSPSGRYLSIFLILIFSGVLAAITFMMPVYRPIERLIFVEDALWAISWVVIARSSFLEKKAGFPPGAMAVTLAVELYLCTHYLFIDQWNFNPWLLVNYVLWPVTSLFNLATIWKFSREEIVAGGEKTKFIQRMGLSVAGYFLFFWFIARSLHRDLVMVYLGQSVIWLISLYFILLILRRPDSRGISLMGNILRFSAGVMCFYANAVVRASELTALSFINFIMITIVLMDLVFLVLLIQRKRVEK